MKRVALFFALAVAGCGEEPSQPNVSDPTWGGKFPDVSGSYCADAPGRLGLPAKYRLEMGVGTYVYTVDYQTPKASDLDFTGSYARSAERLDVISLSAFCDKTYETCQISSEVVFPLNADKTKAAGEVRLIDPNGDPLVLRRCPPE